MNLDRIENIDNAIESAKLLAAQPFMNDPNFKRSIVLICDHHDEGTLGFILNKPLKMKLNDLLADFPDFEVEVFFGGPVQTDTLHFIHNVGDLLPDSQEVAEGVYWGGDYEELKKLVNTKIIKPHNVKFFVGYTGWSPGQLKGEMYRHSWILADFDTNYVFKKTGTNALWEKVLYNQGNIFSVISQVPEVVSWN